MSIFNPWREAAELREQLERAEKEALGLTLHLQKQLDALTRANRDMEIQLRTTAFERDSALSRIKSMHRRDPKTGRILPKGK